MLIAENEDKNSEILKLLIKKDITTENIIYHLRNNRSNLSDQFILDKTENSKTDKLLEVYATNSFVSYFLNLLHEESNTYLPQRSLTQASNQQNKITSLASTSTTATTNPVNKNCIPEEGAYNASFIISPHNNPPQTSKRKSFNPSPKNDYFFKSSPKDTYNNPPFVNKNKPKNVAVLEKTTGSFSTPKFSSNNIIQSKLTTKHSLSDFFQSPTLQASKPGNDITNTRSNDMIEDFKSRFYLHQNKLCNQLEQKLDQPTSNNSANNQNSKIDCADIRNKILSTIDQATSSKIILLAKLFADLFLNNLIITINTELFFLFQLLTFNPNEEKSKELNKEMRIFQCVEHCVYFSIKVLSSMESILRFLKSSTLQELKDNIYIKSFADSFSRDSILNTSLLSKKEEIKSQLVLYEIKQAPFYNENGNKNFHEKNFSKNQRDLFFDILWDWERYHKLENWNFSIDCGDRIRALVLLNDNSTNFFQFVKLFQEQLVLLCKHDKMLIDNKNNEIDGPEHIRSNYDHLKLKRLSARMSTPVSNYGPNPSPKFLGYQEFFKEFIDISNSSVFHQCLKDSLSNEIEIIHKKIPDETANNELALDQDSARDIFLKLRVLGKFLGYLFFNPYNYPIPSYILNQVTEIRNNSLMPINLKSYLERSVEKRHLILTVPFIVEFLSMMDQNAFFIDSIKETISVLLTIYYSQTMSIKSPEFSIDKFLLLLSISWLIQLKKIPSNQPKVNSKVFFSQQKRKGLDDTSIITPVLLHFCCPYLDELQNLMIKFSTGVKRFEQKIHDISSFFSIENQVKPSNEISDPMSNNQKIQMKLMAQFLFLHPNCKRQIDYAIETQLSNFIKYYREKIFKKQLMEALESELNDAIQKQDLNIELEKSLKPLSKKLAKDFRKHCIENGKIFFQEKIQKLIECSLEETTPSQIVSVSSQIGVYQALQKLLQWCDRNLSEEIFHQELVIKASKRKKDEDACKKKEQVELVCQSEESHLVLYNLLSLMKNLVANLIRKDCDSTRAEISIRELFLKIKEYFLSKKSDKKDLKPFETQIFASISEIILFHLANTQDRKQDDSFVDLLVEIEKAANSRGTECGILKSIISPRNFYYVNRFESKENATDFFKKIREKLH